jgi:hypothetical protein
MQDGLLCLLPGALAPRSHLSASGTLIPTPPSISALDAAIPRSVKLTMMAPSCATRRYRLASN